MRIVPVIALSLALAVPAFAKAKVHTAAVGKPHLVTWTTAEQPTVRLSLLVRPLIVDGRRKEWVIGDVHQITDHSFVVLQVQHLNDALPTDPAPHFIWQTGAWLLVERNTGRVTPLHLAGFDPALSGISWFRDFAAYCSLGAGGRSLDAELVELGQRKPVAHKKISDWPLPAPAKPDTPPAPPPPPAPVSPLGGLHHGPAPRVPSIIERMNTGAPHPAVCGAIEWDRDPLRAVITPRQDMPPVPLELGLPATTPDAVLPD
jgi:hypothetical protein